MCHGGDFIQDNGSGGKSIHVEKFEDENFIWRYSNTGILFMANTGPGTNGSRFFSCSAKTKWLDGKPAVLGKVKDSMSTVECVRSRMARPGSPLLIVDSANDLCASYPVHHSFHSSQYPMILLLSR